MIQPSDLRGHAAKWCLGLRADLKKMRTEGAKLHNFFFFWEGGPCCLGSNKSNFGSRVKLYWQYKTHSDVLSPDNDEHMIKAETVFLLFFSKRRWLCLQFVCQLFPHCFFSLVVLCLARLRHRVLTYDLGHSRTPLLAMTPMLLLLDFISAVPERSSSSFLSWMKFSPLVPEKVPVVDRPDGPQSNQNFSRLQW